MGREYVEDIGIDGKSEKVWIGYIWLRIWTSA
jgi:hypothetical protein